jgi:hypothetical protein
MENTNTLEGKHLNMSPTIGELAKALSKAQSVLEGSLKDAKNPFFKSSYSTLSSVWDACRTPLSDNGLSVVQTSAFLPDHPDMVCIETMLCHSSGEWVKGTLAVKPVKADPQGVGSAITYLRRYSLQSIVGIAPEDDDGNAASGKGEEKKKKTGAFIDQKKPDDVPLEPSAPPKQENSATGNVPNSTATSAYISEAQGKRFFAISNKSELPLDQVKLFLMHYYSIDSSKKIPKDKYDEICSVIESKEKFSIMMSEIPA